MTTLCFLSEGTKDQLSLPWKQFQQADPVRFWGLGFSMFQAAESKPQGKWNSLTWAVSTPLDKEGNQATPLQPTQHNFSINILQPPTFPSMIQ